MIDRPTISIVGPGKVGTALGVLAARSGWTVAAVGGRDPAKTDAAARTICSETRACSPAEAAKLGDVVFLTVPDDAIESVCRQLDSEKAFRPGTIVVHCSGALGSESLQTAKENSQCSTGSCHPLQTFPTAGAAMEKLSDAYFFCEGEETALDVLEKLVGDIGGKFVQISSGDRKALYHAGAVMACNYLTALIDAGVTLMEQAGVEPNVALEALGPLVRTTIENVLTMGPNKALTGPIARGDVETVRRHLEVMGGDVEAFYRAAGRWTLNLAQSKEDLDESKSQELRKLFGESAGE